MIARLLGWLAPYLLPAAGAAALVLLLGLGVQTVRLAHSERSLAELQSAWDKDRAQRAEVARIAEADARAEERRRTAAQEEAHVESQRFAARARADADVRRVADVGLQHAVATVAARCGAPAGDPAAAVISPAASAPGDLLAYVQRRMGQAAGEVVEYADQLRAASGECAARYGALMPP